MALFGTKVRNNLLGRERFLCPECGACTPSERSSRTEYLAVLGIRTIPLERLGEFLTCGACAREFAASGVSWNPRSAISEILRSIHGDLVAGMEPRAIAWKLRRRRIPPAIACALMEAAEGYVAPPNYLEFKPAAARSRATRFTIP